MIEDNYGLKKKARDGLDYSMEPLLLLMSKTKRLGVLGYVLTKILLSTEPETYNDYVSLIGVLEDTKQELYMRKEETNDRST